MPRSIVIDLEDGFGFDTDRNELNKAIGYACMWGIQGSAQNIHLHGSADHSLTCSYFTGPTKEDKLHFYMVGIYDKETRKYSFHS